MKNDIQYKSKGKYKAYFLSVADYYCIITGYIINLPNSIRNVKTTPQETGVINVVTI